MKLYMIRHGQSEANITGVYGGQHQIPLTAQGEEEARQAAKILKGLEFDKIYSSDLIRAIRTQELAYPAEDVERLEILREMDVGELVGKKPEECFALWGEPYLADRARANFVPYGGEDRAMIYARAKKFLKMLEDCPYERVAAFSHNGFICSVMRIAMGLGPEEGNFLTKNCALSTFEYKDGKWRVETWNYNGDLS